MKKLFVNNNGKILENDGPTIEAANRGHLYGDGLFESIRIYNGKPINVNVHIMRLIEGMAALKIRIPSFFNEEFFTKRFQELIDQSEITEGGRVRLSVDRTSGGSFCPESNEATYFIEVYRLESNPFTLNSKGWEVDLYTALRQDKNILSNFKTKNCLINVLGAIEAKEKGFDDLLLTSSKGEVLEGTGSNIFVVSNNILYTPGLEQGCIGGTMRMTVINLALENNIKVYESPIMPQNLLIADQVFLTNAIKGIIWVGGYRTKRYHNTMAQRFVEFLNRRYS